MVRKSCCNFLSPVEVTIDKKHIYPHKIQNVNLICKMFVLEWALPLVAILAISSTGANLGKFEELNKPAKVFSRQVEHDLPLDNRLDIKATKVKGLQESVTFKVGTKR